MVYFCGLFLLSADGRLRHPYEGLSVVPNGWVALADKSFPSTVLQDSCTISEGESIGILRYSIVTIKRWSALTAPSLNSSQIRAAVEAPT